MQDLGGGEAARRADAVASSAAAAPRDIAATTTPALYFFPISGLAGDLRSHAAPAAVMASLETPEAAVAEQAPAAEPEPAPAASTEPGSAAPLPPPRPAELGQRAQKAETAAPAARKTAAATAAEPENVTFFDKVFGPLQPAGKALAYAAPQTGLLDGLRGRGADPTAAYDGLTAVYDISAHTVYLPDGTRLEAHSGLGDKIDDPRYVHVRMRGATPPHVYDLTFRERLFHGVRAIRLTPVGGEEAIHGRAGLLAHTYMLGPRGDSNGCVSFKNYAAFLRAFERGEVKRLVVVSGR